MTRTGKALILLLLAGCSSGGDETPSALPGFGSGFTVASFYYGRAVTVVDQNDEIISPLKVINPGLETGGVYELTVNAITGGEKLKINLPRNDPAFDSALEGTFRNSAGGIILPVLRDTGPGEPGAPFFPRNGALAIQFTKPVNPASVSTTTVQVRTGLASSLLPYGGIEESMDGIRTVDESDPTLLIFSPIVNSQQSLETGLPINAIGFPPTQSVTDVTGSITLPVQVDEVAGINQVLEDIDGNPLEIADNNRPIDDIVTTADESLAIEQRLRYGGNFDPNFGFLEDNQSPRLLGSQPVAITSVAGDTDAEVCITFNDSTCAYAFQAGDFLLQGSALAEVKAAIDPSPCGGSTVAYQVRVVTGSLASGPGFYKTAFDEDLHAGQESCFVTLNPLPDSPGDFTTLDPSTTFTVEFSEPVQTSSTSFSRQIVLTNRDEDVAPKDGIPDQTGDPIVDLTLKASEEVDGNRGATLFNIVPVDVARSPSRKVIELLPLSPLPDRDPRNLFDKIYDFHIVSGDSGVLDLAGNPLGNMVLNFRLGNLETNQGGDATLDQASGGITLRWLSPTMDEDGDIENRETNAANQGQGQGLHLVSGGGVRGRDATVYRRTVDNTNTFLKIMPTTFAGLQTPLVPLGARMMILARHHDLFSGRIPTGEIGAIGPSLADRDGWDVNIVGLNWAPFGGNLLPDIFGRIALNLGHSYYAPIARVEPVMNWTKPWQDTGFHTRFAPYNEFDAQVLETMDQPPGPTENDVPVAVGMRSSTTTAFDTEYKVISSNVFRVGNNLFTPWPEFSNKDFIYRDRTLVETSTNPSVRNPFPPPPRKGACNQIDPTGPDLVGYPFMGGGFLLDNNIADGHDSTEFQKAQVSRNFIYKYKDFFTLEPERVIPSIAMPLLMEFKTYPTEQTGVPALGVNGFATSFAFNTNQTGVPNPNIRMNIMPSFRCFSQGYFNPLDGSTRPIDPDNEITPRGGFSPVALSETAAFDPTLYWQVYEMQNCWTVFFSRWLDTGFANPTFDGISIEPEPEEMPFGTAIVVEFRGAQSVVDVDGNGGSAADDADVLDPYGNCNCPDSNSFWTCDMTHIEEMTDWTTDITSLDGGGYQWIQVRVRLQCDLESAKVPDIRTLGISFHETP